MQAAQSRQKSYADKRRRSLEFQVGDYVYLKITLMKKKRFGIKKKLVARFVGPYRIIEKKGTVAYKLQLPESDEFNLSRLSCITIEEVFVCSGRENRTSGYSDQGRLGIS
jgi:hypothetical protein